MTIDKLNDYALKIYLDKYDFDKFGMSINDINVRSVRTILLEISDDISQWLNIDLDREKLYVEVFSQKSGCMIFVSYTPEKKKSKNMKKNILCQFDNYNLLENLCNVLKLLYSDSIKDSILYCNEYVIRLYLKIKSNYESIFNFASDYGEVISGDEINLGATEEYFQKIISENAIDTVLSRR